MKNILFILLTFLSYNLYAQEDESAKERYTIGILPVTASDYNADRYKETVAALITKVFSGKARFIVVDRGKLDQVISERNLQKQEDFIDGLIVEQGKSLGAQYLISGNITQVNAIGGTKTKYRSVKNPNTGKFESQPYTVYIIEATVRLNMQVIDVATGQVKSSEILASRQAYETRDEQYVINAAVNSLEGFIKAWANKVFPVYMKVVRIEKKDKKGMPELILIKGGNDMDLQKSRTMLGINTSSELEIYENEIENIDGVEYKRAKVIGKAVITEAQGELSVCKVKSGEELLLQKLNEGKTLLLRIKHY